MEHRTITICKWTFFLVGMALLLLVAAAILFDETSLEGAIVLSLFGSVFALIGGGIIAYGWLSKSKEAELRQHGRLIQADFQQVEINKSLEVNGTNPFRIVAQWHDTANNELLIFKSASLWFDPSKFIQNRKIPVYVDPRKLSRYHVDLSFLPKVKT